MESLSKSLPLYSSVLIVSSLLFNIRYYSFFGIRITEYIDLSEALLLFLPVAYQAKFLVAALLFTLVCLTEQFWDYKSLPQRNHLYSSFVRRSTIDELEPNLFVKLIFPILSVTLVATVLANPSSGFLSTILLIDLGFITLFLPLVLSKLSFQLRNRFTIRTSLLKAIYLVCCTLFLVWYSAELQISMTLRRMTPQTTLHFTQGVTYGPNDSTYFIGKSNKYAFYYSANRTTTNAISLNDVKFIETKLYKRRKFK